MLCTNSIKLFLPLRSATLALTLVNQNLKPRSTLPCQKMSLTKTARTFATHPNVQVHCIRPLLHFSERSFLYVWLRYSSLLSVFTNVKGLILTEIPLQVQQSKNLHCQKYQMRFSIVIFRTLRSPVRDLGNLDYILIRCITASERGM